MISQILFYLWCASWFGPNASADCGIWSTKLGYFLVATICASVFTPIVVLSTRYIDKKWDPESIIPMSVIVLILSCFWPILLALLCPLLVTGLGVFAYKKLSSINARRAEQKLELEQNLNEVDRLVGL